MTVTTTERKPAAERIAVRCVDSDVHPVPKSGVLAQYIPEPWRSKYFLPRRIGDQIYYDAPDYAHAYAMRMDTFPADGEFAGSDPDLAFKQLIMEAGADIAILEPAAYPGRFPEVNHAMSCALNDWQANHWLDSHNNWHERWRGSICAAIEAPEDGAREIERWAGHPYMGQILIKAEPRPAWGDPKYDPIWAAATTVMGLSDVRPDVARGHDERHHGELSPVPRPPRGAADPSGRIPQLQPRFHGHLLAAGGEPGDEPDLRRGLRPLPHAANRVGGTCIHVDPAADVADGRDLRGPQVL